MTNTGPQAPHTRYSAYNASDAAAVEDTLRNLPGAETLATEASDRVGEAHLRQRTFTSLSGGRQRVLIARALAQQGQHLLLDGPTNHLDIRYQHEVLPLVRSLGVTTLVVLHELNLAAQYCDDHGCEQRPIADQRYWNHRARAYDAHQQRDDRLEADQAVWTRVLARALSDEATDVLDLGTGSGYLAFLLADLGYTVTATDLSEGMLAVAADRVHERAAEHQPNPIFELGDAFAPDFEPESIDAITNRYVMWTLRDPLAALFNCKRLLRPVSQLAAAVESTPNAVTQALRKLHEASVAEPRTQRRHRRWRLTDRRIHELLHHVAAPHSDLHPEHP